MNDKNKMDILKGYALQFRKAIIISDLTQPVTLTDFPHGACGDSSWLLGRYLREKGIQDVEYVSGMKYIPDDGDYRPQSHAWLEVSRVIVDITADQFDNVNEEVVITDNKSWHKQFGNQRRMIADYNAYDSPANRNLDRAYKIICNNISE